VVLGTRRRARRKVQAGRPPGEQPETGGWIVAVRRRDGRRVVFGSPGAPTADIGTAVAASCAIPAYLTPSQIDGVDHIDGGVHSPTNADLLAGCDLDLMVVSSPMSVDLRSVRPRVDLPIRLHARRRLQAAALSGSPTESTA
jgi:NTE family protein